MKTALLFCAMSLSLLGASAQQAKDKDAATSNADKFLLKTGVLFQKNITTLGKFKATSIDVIEIINLSDKSKVKSLRLKKDPIGEYESDHVGVIDNDEVEGLIKSLELIKSNVIAITPDVYTEVSYKSRGGFEAGGYYSDTDKAWHYYLKMSKYDEKSYQFFKSNELEELLTFLNSAKPKLQ